MRLTGKRAFGCLRRSAAPPSSSPTREAERHLAEETADILVTCAGLVVSDAVIGGSDADWSDSRRANVMAPMDLIRDVVPRMIARGGDAIVNVAAVASGIAGAKNRAAYGATKAVLIGFTTAVAREPVGDGIRCNALCPGTTDTPSLETRVARQGIGRLGRPEAMAEAAVFLAADAAALVTGQLLVIDGGQTL